MSKLLIIYKYIFVVVITSCYLSSRISCNDTTVTAFVITSRRSVDRSFTSRIRLEESSRIDEGDFVNNIDRTVTILSRGPNHIIAMKPPSVVCHHSNWAGSRKKKLKIGEVPEIPMLQRVRDAIDSIDNIDDEKKVGVIDANNRNVRRINLVHRLDRGASGALLFAFADDNDDDQDDDEGIDNEVMNQSTDEHQQFKRIKKIRKKGPTATLQAEMAKPTSIKTYVALVRGEGILNGEDFKTKGWFEVSRPIKDEKGRLNDATTLFRFVAGQAEPQGEMTDDNDRIRQPRISLVLARPQDGRWHQIRRHLNGLSHPILGDTSHGSSKTNREWKEKRNLPGERVCLHLARLEMLATNFTDPIDCSCPIPDDMLNMLRVYAPNVLQEAIPELEKEGIILAMPEKKYVVGTYKIPDKLLNQMMGIDGDEVGKDSRGHEVVEILSSTENYVVVSKPPGIVVHGSSWTKIRKHQSLPMVQRVREATGRKVNPIHRLDKSASGCLIFAFAENDKNENYDSRDVTNTLIGSLQSKDAMKTYLALCDGDGTWNGKNFLDKGWFRMDQPVKDENGKAIHAVTDICFVSAMTIQSDDDLAEGRKIALVLAKPSTGKYHQIRQHLASGFIGHAILGDSSHGRSRTNRIWKKKRNLRKERTCLHLIKIDLPPTRYSPDGIRCYCPLPSDMNLLMNQFPELLESARPTLEEEGLVF